MSDGGVAELQPLTDAQKLEMLEHFGIQFVPYKDSSGPAKWVITLREGKLLHKFDAERLRLITEAVYGNGGVDPDPQTVHLEIPRQTLVDLLEDEQNQSVLIQANLGDEGVALDLFDHECQAVASTWKLYQEMGLRVRSLPEEGRISKIQFTLKDRLGNPSETRTLGVAEALDAITNFVEVLATDPEENGKDAQGGSVEFLPVIS